MTGSAGAEPGAALERATPAPPCPGAARAICREPGDAAFVVALCALPGIGPAMLRALLARRGARACWDAVRSGTLAVPTSRRSTRDDHERLARWRAAAAGVDPADLLDRARERGISVHVLGDPSYPALLARELSAPVVCFTAGAGDLAGLGSGPEPSDAPARVAIVGTRSATHYGTEVAADLGAGLSEAGVCVVSGLAAGIDAAAHDGAIAGGVTPPLAIVGGGVDVVYPARNRRLWTRLLAVGTVLSEAPPGAAPERWRFPLRNRLVAAASDLVIVVEAHRSGGAMYTVDAALARGVLVAAVPGSVRSPASEGTNALIADGAAVVRDVDDARALLELVRAGQRVDRRRSRPARSQPDAPAGDRPTRTTVTDMRSPSRTVPAEVTDAAGHLLAAFDDHATSLEALLARTGLGIGAASLALDRLVESGRVRRRAGLYERVAADGGDRARREGVGRAMLPSLPDVAE